MSAQEVDRAGVEPGVVRIAAVGDLHSGLDSAGSLRPHLADLHERADLFLVAGDLTRHGDPAEAAVLAGELSDLGVPTVAVLGNHDYHSDQEDLIRKVVEEVGIRVLEGDSVVLDLAGTRVGVAGTKGFGGGFTGACGSAFGEREMKAFVGHTEELAARLEQVLDDLREQADLRVALLHYSPVPETLEGERLEIFPFLGSHLLAQAVDSAGADLVLHGHAHYGAEEAATPGGVPVRNVAQTVIDAPYRVYRLDVPTASG